MEEIHKFSGVGIGMETGAVSVGTTGELIGYLDNYNRNAPLKTEAVVSGALINIQYYTNGSSAWRNVCVDVRSKKIHHGTGEFFHPAVGVILVKNLVSSESYGAKTGDKVILFSDLEPLGKVFSGKFIGYHGEFYKKLVTGNRLAYAIESRDELGKFTGVLLFSAAGKVLFAGSCTAYKAGSKSQFIIYVGRRVVRV